MKLLSPLHPQTGRTDSRGISLITVLALVTLLSLVMLAFLTRAKQISRDVETHDGEMRAAEIADGAIQLATSQIQRATSGKGIGWASQPGVIRTWNESGRFEAGFKLYSDDRMVESNEKTLVEEDYHDLADWDERPWQYVDLNEPAFRGEKVRYPVVDPSARDLPKWSKAGKSDDSGIEGFYYTTEGIGKGPAQKALAMKGAEPLPLPVKWIYQLKDGTMGVLDEARRFVPAEGGSLPSKSNPMVARFAFWADDETCKLNPNVHAGGMPTVPIYCGGAMNRRSARIPALNEWQRYPGHPAGVELGPVLLPGHDRYSRDSMKIDYWETIYTLIPKVVGGGTESATRLVELENPKERRGLIPDHDRLYASLDDFLLTPKRGLNSFVDSAAPRRRLTPIEAAEMMERSRFFLSVNNRSPETTQFDTPRISLWPTHEHSGTKDSVYHTAHDRLLRFCAEVGKANGEGRFPYHFQRKNADSTTADYEEILRNRELYAYLDRLTGSRVPGFGMSFSGKYDDSERLQILTEIFDYIRSTNLHDDFVYGEEWKDAYSQENENSADHLTYTNGRILPTHLLGYPEGSQYNQERPPQKPILWAHPGHGQVTPIKIQHRGVKTKGLGRFFTIQNMAVQVIACADGGDGSGGGGWQPAHPGVVEYPGVWKETPSGKQFSNFPPLPKSVVREDPSSWPEWLGKLKEEGEDWVDLAFDPENWNWQLAWLDPVYEQAMPQGKFVREQLSDAGISRLEAGEKLVQAVLIWDMFCPSQGGSGIVPDMVIDFQIEGMNFVDAGGGAVSIGWPQKPAFGAAGPAATSWGSSRSADPRFFGVRGGPKFHRFFQSAGITLPGEITPSALEPYANTYHFQGRTTPLDRNSATASRCHQYAYVTRPFKVSDWLRMDSGTVKARIYAAGGSTGDAPNPDSGALTERTEAQTTVPDLVQELEIPFRGFQMEAPPLAPGLPEISRSNRSDRADAYWQRPQLGPMHFWSLTWDGPNPLMASIGRMAIGPMRLSSTMSPPHVEESDLGFLSEDVVQSVGVGHADSRMSAAKADISVEDAIFQPHRLYGQSRQAHSFLTPTGICPGGQADPEAVLVPHLLPGRIGRQLVLPSAAGDAVQRFGDFDNGLGAHFDGPYIGKPDEGDGHYLMDRAFPDAWREYRDLLQQASLPNDVLSPYFTPQGDFGYSAGNTSILPGFRTPNRIISSAGMLGSLPVGSTRNQPWRTLLFRPNVTGGRYDSHPGAGSRSSLPDHLWMDLFWMPVVEPYAISETFSTAGKVNLNYQMLPFRHIKRDTALRGVLKPGLMTCIPNKWAGDYKVEGMHGTLYHWRDNPSEGKLLSRSLMSALVVDDTLAQFEKRFDDPLAPTVFRTASEICDIHLIPEEVTKRMMGEGFDDPKLGIQTYVPTVEDMEKGKYWSDHALVGDNARENPYATLYAKLTTKSNSYRVHYRAEVIQQGAANGQNDGRDFAVWDTLLDKAVAEHRGSALVERYLEPGDEIPDYATDADAPPLGEFYHYRVMEKSKFVP
jgi:hypothetical protein